MSVHGINNNTVEKNQNNQVPGKSLSQQDFMKLFLAQMRAQSPLKPFDSGEMMQQMSAMTSVSATAELEKTVQMMNSNLGRSQVLSATQLIGKRATIASDKSPLINNKDGTASLDGSIILPQSSTAARVEIRDTSGNLVKAIDLAASSAGVQDFHWDGRDADGKLMPEGFYSISANANMGGQNTQVYTAGVFKVTSVTMDRKTSAVILNVDGMGGMDMGDIVKILS